LDIVSVEESRVPLPMQGEEEVEWGSNYINANFVQTE